MCVFFNSILTSWQFSLCNFISCLAKWSDELTELNRIRRQSQPNPFDYATLDRLATHKHTQTGRQTDRLPFVCPFNGGVALSTFRRWKMGKNRIYSIGEPSFIVFCLVFFLFLTFCSCFLAAFLSLCSSSCTLFIHFCALMNFNWIINSNVPEIEREEARVRWGGGEQQRAICTTNLRDLLCWKINRVINSEKPDRSETEKALSFAFPCRMILLASF